MDMRRLTLLLAATAALFVQPASGDERSELKLWRAVHNLQHVQDERGDVRRLQEVAPQASAGVDAAIRALHDKYAAKIEGAERVLSDKSAKQNFRSESSLRISS